nr:hypothetical protein [Tanacetum cinerariifolium]
MTFFNGICDNCIYGAGMLIICHACGGIVRGGLCLPCDLREKNLYNYVPNAYSFNNSNYFPQPQDENYLCNLCGNNSHDDYDCQQQFPKATNVIPKPGKPFLQFNDNHVQNKESPENSSEETVVSKTNQEPPQDSDIHQLMEECSIKVSEQQKQKMEDTMLELVKICQEKEFLCIHDDIDDLIESALDSKLLLINSNSQRLDKKEQKVKNVIAQPAEHGNRIAPIQSTKEPEHLLSMGYEHFSITPETESDEVTDSNAENLLPFPSKCEVTLKDEIECDMPAKDICSPVFTTFSNPLFKDNDDLDSSDDESLPDEDVPAEEFKIYSNSLFDEDKINSDKLDPHCFNVEYDFVESLLNRDTLPFPSKCEVTLKDEI